jgi:hypothetical protein
LENLKAKDYLDDLRTHGRILKAKVCDKLDWIPVIQDGDQWRDLNEYSNELSVIIKIWDSLDQMTDYKVLKQDLLQNLINSKEQSPS